MVEKAFEQALSLLLERSSEWNSVLEAYWLLRRNEDRVGFPFTYNMVEQLVEEAKRLMAARRGAVAAAEA
ncbi:MAG: hypothetical protein GXO15_02270 [Crenarchaeota archaeon]|nr:hypothetical protein [Thermoproteota archaeon]